MVPFWIVSQVLWQSALLTRVRVFFFFSSRRRHTRLQGDWSSDVCSSDLRSQRQVRSMLSGLDGSRRAALLEAMSVIRGAFSAPAGQAQVSLRTHRPGDMGWGVERHGALYFREYGWDEEFEALVAGVTSRFLP